METTLTVTLAWLRRHLGPLLVGPLFRTAAWRGNTPDPQQPAYLNTAAVGTTALPADAVLALAKACERAAGRRPAPRDAARPLDIDLLLFGSRISALPELTLPHPRLTERAFALAPLAAVAPRLRLPDTGSTVAAALARLPRPDAGLSKVAWRFDPEPG